MPNYANNIAKVIFGGQTLIDLTSDTVDAAHLLYGYTAHGADGALVTGSCDFDANTSDATATASEILATKTAYKNGSKLTGSMTNNGAVTGSISDASSPYTIPQGYHDGSGTVGIASAELAKLIASNIREDITILGVTGTMTGQEDVHATTVTLTPYITSQTVSPGDIGAQYNYISEVTVNAIYYDETEAASGGTVATIGTVAPAPANNSEPGE